jgi:16S rRNA (guanine527-N7)-methyltransferase
VSKSNVNLLETLLREKGRFDGRPFSDGQIDQFLNYYHLVVKWNPRLHLTTLSDPRSFFERHLRESEFAEKFLLPEISQVWDLGSGLGVPGVPLAIIRKDLLVTLVESKRHKAIFLEEVASSLNLTNLAIANIRIEAMETLPTSSCLAARAVEQMESLIPTMFRIGNDCAQMLFFGSEKLEVRLRTALSMRFEPKRHLLPGSSHRILISLIRST